MHRADTVAVHAGRDDLTALGVHVPPIDLSTTYPLPSVASGGDAYDRLGGGLPPLPTDSLVYQRLWNPTVARFERAVAALEGFDEAVAFASGMAALNAVLLACVVTGRRHVVAVRPLYGGTDHVLSTGLLGTEVTWATAGPDEGPGDHSGIAEAIRPETALVIVETPANPTLDLLDLAGVVRAAGDVPVLVDNTFATPILQRPKDFGAALVLHSATKFFGGHGDAMGGVVAATPDWAARLRQIRSVTGGLLHPQGAYQLHRGLQTLPVRVRAAQQSATAIADWLRDHPSVARVMYPGLKECDPLGLVGTQMSGPGSILSFELRGGFAAAESATRAVRLITHAVSLGGVDSLLEHPAGLTHRPVDAAARPSDAVLRLSVGLEDADDLVDDLDRALGARS